jgi:hypothetical protein
MKNEVLPLKNFKPNCWAYNLFLVNYFTFLNGFEISIKFCFFVVFIDKKNLTCNPFKAKCAQNGPKRKHTFDKYVLE